MYVDSAASGSNFAAGDDWAVALGVVVALAATWVATHHGRNLYWVLPVLVIALIAVSLRRASRDDERASRNDSKISSWPSVHF
jgi:UDP-N-acetylmuramyl pentapeptide phosphotransferase/UDP-N-acetylglucosamine-1-phosphate transferase